MVNVTPSLQIFLEESRDVLSEMDRILLDLKMGCITSEQLDSLSRSVHTLKDSAGVSGFDNVEHFSLQVERVLDRLRSGAVHLDGSSSGLLFRCLEYIKTLLDALATHEPPSAEDGMPLLAELTTWLNEDRSPDPIDPDSGVSLPGPAGRSNPGDDLLAEAKVLRIGLSGELSIYNVLEIRDQLLSALQDGAQGSQMEVDLSRVPEIDSAGVQLMISARREADQREIKLRFVGVNAELRQTLDLCEISERLGVSYSSPCDLGQGSPL
jgi:anti-anti-sigma factor